MPLTMMVTRDIEVRYRGFLTSIMLEIAPGVCVAPDMSAGVRERAWNVLTDWWLTLGNGSLVLVWRDAKSVGSLGIRTLGELPKEIVDAEGVLLARRKQGDTRSPVAFWHGCLFKPLYTRGPPALAVIALIRFESVGQGHGSLALAGIAAQVEAVWKRDPFAGNSLVVQGRRGDLVYMIWWDGQGACLVLNSAEAGVVCLDFCPKWHEK